MDQDVGIVSTYHSQEGIHESSRQEDRRVGSLQESVCFYAEVHRADLSPHFLLMQIIFVSLHDACEEEGELDQNQNHGDRLD